ncbi:MAG: aldo/keto reductase [Eubacteriales bacterium]|nr:aldo/keto reductase [Eubacteriales bacterium]
MEYRTFEKTGEKISLLGFGTMRLPVRPGKGNEIDEEEAIKAIRFAIDSGVNYVDTAYMYHSGKSEGVLGKALKDGYREKVFLADKMPVWSARDEGGLEGIFQNQLKRLGVESIDFYLIHNITRGIFRLAQKLETIAFLEQKKKEGKIKHLGFSYHDDFEFFMEVIDAYPWDFCQIQLNFMDENFQAGLKGLKYAGQKGIPVIVMEPLKGGKLTQALPDSVREIWEASPWKRSPAEWALKYVADFPEVLTILSGMSSLEQTQDNIRILSDAKPGMLSEEEKATIARVAAEYNKLIKASCTACRYCMPCPQNVEIPKVIDYYNQWHLYMEMPAIKRDFNMNLSQKNRPSNCIDCKVCEEKCPQHLPIAQIMKDAAEIFES